MNITKFIAGSTLGAVIAVTMSASAFAHPMGGQGHMQKANFDEERHSQMEEILESNDFQAWSDFMIENAPENAPVNSEQFFTEERFNQMIEMHDAMEDDDFEGFKRGFKKPKGPRFDSEVRDQIDTALENGDFAAWSEIMATNIPEDAPIGAADFLTEEHFDQMLEMHQKMLNGEFEGFRKGKLGERGFKFHTQE